MRIKVSRAIAIVSKSLFVVLLPGLLSSGTALAQARIVPPSSGAASSTVPKVQADWGRMPLAFERNTGQYPSGVDFVSRGQGYSMYLKPTEAIVALYAMQRNSLGSPEVPLNLPRIRTAGTQWLLRTRLVGANSSARPEPADELQARLNYIVGRDPSKWQHDVPTYGKVRYQDVYPGIDLLYYGNQRQIEYDFIVSPGADPKRIQMSVSGANSIEKAVSGDVVIHVGAGEVRLRNPEIYQLVAGVRKPVPGGFVVRRADTIEFEVGEYDKKLPLIIDPVLAYSFYFGGGHEAPDAIQADAAGNLYFLSDVGTPGVGTLGAFDSTCGTDANCNFNFSANAPHIDAFVGKINANGSLAWGTYLGGSNDDFGIFGGGLVTDAAGNVYVTGATNSSDFPLSPGAFLTVCPDCSAGISASFVAKLSANGSSLLYSTYIHGGTRQLQIGPGGLIYVGGRAFSSLPTTPDAYQPTNKGGFDGYVAVLDPTKVRSAQLVYSTFFGGSGNDTLTSLSVDTAGNMYMIGSSNSADLPQQSPFTSIPHPGAFKSTDSGTTWTTATGLIANTNILCIAPAPSLPSTIYACSQSNAQVVKSTDSGSTWTAVGTSLPTNGSTVFTIAVHPTDPNTVFAVTGINIFKSTDGGGTWSRTDGGFGVSATGNNFARFNAFAIDPNSPPGALVLLAGVRNSQGAASLNQGAMYRSIDSGQTWTQINFPGPVGSTPNAEVTSIAYSKSSPGVIYASLAAPAINTGAPTGVYRSIDFGVSWALKNSGFGTNLLFVHPATGTVYAGTNRSTDSGATFVSANVGAGLVAFDPANPTTVYAGNTTTIFKSIDSGATYTAVTTLPTSTTVRALTFAPGLAPGAPGSLLVGTILGGDIFFAKLSSDKHTLLYSSFLGNRTPGISVGGRTIQTGAVDGNGSMVTCAYTNANDVPLVNAVQSAPAGQQDPFFVKVKPDGSGLVFSTYYGGTLVDNCFGVATDAQNNIYFTGETNSANFPLTADAVQGLSSGGGDAWVAKFSPTGTPIFSTYLGGTNFEEGIAITVDGLGDIYVAGDTASSDFPNAVPLPNSVAPPASNPNGVEDGFFTKIAFSADLFVTQDPIAPVPVGGTAIINVNVGNNGPADALGVSGGGTAPLGTTVASVTAAGGGATCTISTDKTTWSCAGNGSGGISPGEIGNVTLVLNAPTAGAYTNVITVSETNTDPNPGNNTSSLTFTVASPVDLSVGVSPTTPLVALGSNVTYTATVTNLSGTAPAGNVTLVGTLDPTFLKGQVTTTAGTCNNVANSKFFNCALGAIAPGASVTVTAVATPTAPGSYSISFHAQSADTPDPNTANDTATSITTVTGSAPTTQGSRGSDFWIAFPVANPSPQKSLVLMMTSATAASGVVSNASSGLSLPFTIPANGRTELHIPVSNEIQALNTDEAQGSQGLHVTADVPISLSALNYVPQASDGFAALPTNQLGTQYFSIDYPGFGSEFVVVASQPNTTLTITPKNAAATRVAGVSYTVNLANAGDTYFLRNFTTLSGSSITSDKPVAVFSGNVCEVVPRATGTVCDHLVEQLAPVSLWGRSFEVGLIGGRTAPSVARVVASQNGTTIDIDGQPVATLNQGEVYETHFPAGPGGLSAYWNFDETSGKAIDSAGTNDGTLGAGTLRFPGLVGSGSLFFTNSPTSFVDVGAGANGAFTFTTGVTLSAVVQWNFSADAYDEIIRKEDGTNRFLLSFQNDNLNTPPSAGPVLSFGLNVGGTYQELDMPLDGQAGRPSLAELVGTTHHIAATYDSNTGLKAIWIDGTMRFSTNYTAGTLITSGGATNALIGNNSGNLAAEAFNGTIDEVRIYKRALTAAEIAQLATQIQPGYKPTNSTHELTASAPVQVAQFASSENIDNQLGGPFMMLVPPRENWDSTYIFTTPVDEIFTNWMTAILPAGAVGQVTVDGAAVTDTTKYSAIGPSFSQLLLQVTPGVHTVTAPVNFMLQAYGHAFSDGYGFPAGALFTQPAAGGTLVLSPGSSLGTAGTPTCVTAALKDSGGAAIVGAPISFGVSGANTPHALVNTDNAGNAQFCYSGPEGGQDTIFAVYGSLTSNSATINWTGLADVQVSVTDSPNPGAINGQLTYTIKLTNAGPSTAHGLVLTNTISGSATFVSLTTTAACTGTLSATCNLPALAPSQSQTITAIVTPTAAGTVTDAVSATLTETDPNPADNTATRNTPVVQGADLKLTASVTASQIAVGGSTTLNVLVTNNGPVATTATSAVVSVPSNLSFNGFIGASWACNAAGNSPQIVTCTTGTLANGASTSALAIALNTANQGAGGVTITATAPEPDPATANNAAILTVTVAPSATASEHLIYTTNPGGLRARRLSDNTDTINIPGFAALTYGASISPNGRIAFVASPENNYISVLDFTLQAEVARIRDVRAFFPAISSDGRQLVAGNLNADELVVIDTATLQVTKRISLDGKVGDVAGANDLFLISVVLANGRAYVTNFTTNNPIIAVDLTSGAVTPVTGSASSAFAFEGSSMATTPGGRYLVSLEYSPNFAIQIIDTTTNAVVRTITPPSPAIALTVSHADDPHGVLAYVATGNQLLAIDVKTGSPTFGQTLATAPLSNSPLIASLSADGSSIYLQYSGGTFAKVDTGLLFTNPQAAESALPTPPGVVQFSQVQFADATSPAGAPQVTSVTPNVVVDGNSTTVTVSGSNFLPGATVRIGHMEPIAATNITATQLQVAVPNLSPLASLADVIVTVPNASASVYQQLMSGRLAGAITLEAVSSFQPANEAVVSNFGSGTVTTYGRTKLRSAPSDPLIEGIAVSSDGTRVYAASVAGGLNNNIVVSNLDTSQLITRIQSLPLRQFDGVVIRPYPPTGKQVVYAPGTELTPELGVTNLNLQIFDADPASPTYHQLLNAIGGPVADASSNGGVTATSNGRYVYAGAPGGNPKIAIFDVVTGNSASLFTDLAGIDQEGFHLAVTPDDKYLLARSVNGDLVVLDLGDPMNPAVIATVSGGGAQFFGFNAFQVVGNRLFALFTSFFGNPGQGISGSTVVKVFNFDPVGSHFEQLGSYTLTGATPNLLGAGLAVSPDSGTIYVTQDSDDALAVIDTAKVIAGDPTALVARFATDVTPVYVVLSPRTTPTTDVQITKSVQPGNTVPIGSTVLYTLAVKNNGTSPADNVVVQDVLPAGLVLTHISSNLCSAVGQTITCQITSLAGGAVFSTDISVEPVVLGQITNTASVSASTGDSNVANNTSTATITVTGCTMPPGFTKTWIGTDSNNALWSVPNNWSPPGVPTAADSVYVCSTASTAPALDADVAIKDLSVDPTRGLAFGSLGGPAHSLTASGNVSLGNSFLPGTLIMTGSNVTLEGVVPNLQIQGTVRLSAGITGQPNQNPNVTVVSGDFDLGTFSTSLLNKFSTAGTGTLTMTNQGALLNTIALDLQGGSTAGRLTTGTILVSGDITFNAQGFAPSGNNTVILSGAGAQNIQSGTIFNSLTINNISPAGIVLQGPVTVNEALTVSASPSKVSISGNNATLAVTVANIDGLQLTNVPLVIIGTLGLVQNISFLNFDPAQQQLTIQNPGGTFTFANLTFATTPTTGAYITATDTNTSDGNPLVINLQNPTAVNGPAFTRTFGGATVNWPTNPLPVLTDARFGTAQGGTLVIATGSSITAATQVLWDGNAVASTIVSATEVDGFVPTNLLTSGGHTVRLFAPAPGGGTSANAITLNITTGAYSISALVPGAVTAGGNGFSLSVHGTGFTNGMTVLWNGSSRPTTFVSTTELRANISASDITTPGNASVSVQSGATTSNIVALPIAAADPTIDGFTPQNASAGANSMEIKVTGSGFTNTSTVKANGVSRPTTFVSSTEIRGTLTSTDLSAGGSLQITVADSATGKSSPVANYSIADFATQLDATKLTLNRGGSGNVTLTISPKLGSYDNPVALSCSGLPAGATCNFSANNMVPGASARTATVSISVPTTLAMQNGKRLPLLAMLGFGCFGVVLVGGAFRRKARIALYAAALVLTALAMSGCGGGGSGSTGGTPSGTGTRSYVVTITAASGTVQHTASLTLEVQ